MVKLFNVNGGLAPDEIEIINLIREGKIDNRPFGIEAHWEKINGKILLSSSKLILKRKHN